MISASYTDIQTLCAALIESGIKHFQLIDAKGDLIVPFNKNPKDTKNKIDEIQHILLSSYLPNGEYIVNGKKAITAVISLRFMYTKKDGKEPEPILLDLQKFKSVNDNVSANIDVNLLTELAVLRVECEYLKKDIANKEKQILELKQELEAMHENLQDEGTGTGQTNALLELAEKFAPTINTLAESIAGFLIKKNSDPNSSPAPALPALNNVQKSEQSIAQTIKKQKAIQRGTQEHADFIISKLNDEKYLADEANVLRLQKEIDVLNQLNPELGNQINEYIQNLNTNEND
jgi:flagellar motility protein MotE (MotC chaperone)